MPRIVRQKIPEPPAVYDPVYIARLVDAVNSYMVQAQAPAEVIAARFICTDPPQVGGTSPTAFPDTSRLPTGTMILKQVTGAPAGTWFLTVVTPQDV